MGRIHSLALLNHTNEVYIFAMRKIPNIFSHPLLNSQNNSKSFELRIQPIPRIRLISPLFNSNLPFLSPSFSPFPPFLQPINHRLFVCPQLFFPPFSSPLPFFTLPACVQTERANHQWKRESTTGEESDRERERTRDKGKWREQTRNKDA